MPSSTLATTGILIAGRSCSSSRPSGAIQPPWGRTSVRQGSRRPFQRPPRPIRGFNTVPVGDPNHTTMLSLDALMFVGGGPVSTAGGIKVTTLPCSSLAVVAEARW